MSLAYKISRFNRERKWKIFNKLFKASSKATILDVGFTDDEYATTDNFFEKHYPYPQNITALGIEEPIKFAKRYPLVKVVKYDGERFPFVDKTFDLCWSNAVIEHVGDRKKQLYFLKEIRRVANSTFMTTPNKFFPVEVHTRIPLLHLLPKKIFDKFLTLIGKKWAVGDYMNLLSLGDLKGLLRDAGISDYKIIKNKLLFFTLDFIVYFGKIR